MLYSDKKIQDLNIYLLGEDIMDNNTELQTFQSNTIESQSSEIAQNSEKKVDELAHSINLADPSLDITYGTSTMQEISRFSDDLLSRVRAKDSGEVGEFLTNLMIKVKGIDVTDMNKEPNFLEKLPLIGSMFDSVKKTVAKFETLAEQIESISNELDNSLIGLLRDVEILEQLYGHNERFHEDLIMYISAGKKKLEEARSVELVRLQSLAETSGDALDSQRLRDFSEQINRFERRLHDLEVSRTITVQMAPQIRLIQSNNRALAQKIQTSILTTIPIWKNQMVLALTLHGQKQAAALQKDVSDTTNEMLRKNAAMLEQTSLEVTREVQRSIVDIETLREVHNKLISTIDESIRISAEGRQKRIEVEKELLVMEGQLKESLQGLAKNKAQQSIEHAIGEKN